MRLVHFGCISAMLCWVFTPALAQELAREKVGINLPRMSDGPGKLDKLRLPGHPGRGGLPVDADSLIPRLADETLADVLRRKQLQVQIPSDPEAIARALDFQVQQFARDCPKHAYACGQRDELAGVVGRLRLGNGLATGCAAAAARFQDNYVNGDPPHEVARAYDLNCLDSLVRRSVAGVPEQLSSPPAVFEADSATSHGALTAIAIIEDAGRPFCGGLLRNDRTVVTARHCFEKMRSAFAQGTVTARAASGGRAPWKLAAEPVSQPEGHTDAVKDDWVVLRVVTTDAILARETVLQRLAKLDEVTLLGHYAYFPEVDYAPGTPSENWRRGLRYPKAGLCQAIKVIGYCLQVACQTVRGFSGAPIFVRSSNGANDPLQVVGFVSQPDQDAGQCNGFELYGSSYAVSADAVR